MRFACDKCGAGYTIADEKVRGRVLKLRCKRCGQPLIIRGTAGDGHVNPPPPLPPPSIGPDPGSEEAFRRLYETVKGQSDAVPDAPPEPAGAPGAEWHYGMDGEDRGPLTLAGMARAIKSGEVTREHFVWREGMSDWLPIEEVAELVALLPHLPAVVDSPDRKIALEKDREQAIRRRKEADTRRREQQRLPERPAPKSESPRPVVRSSQLGAGSRTGAASNDASREKLLEKVVRKRAAARADRQAGRIAEHFFASGEEGLLDSESLPLPPVIGDEEAAALARQLHEESLAEEHELLQADPLAVIERRVQSKTDEISAVARVIAAQAGVASPHRRLWVALTVTAGAVGAFGLLLWLALAQGWLAIGPFGKQVGGAASEVGEGGESGLAADGHRIRDALWNVKHPPRRDPRPGPRASRPVVQPGPIPELDATEPLSEEEQQLLAFYQGQSVEKREVSPLLPRGLATGPVSIVLPIGPGLPVGSLPEPGGKTEIVPQGPATASGPHRLTDIQVQLVIRRHYRQVKRCFERQLKRDASVAGKMEIVARVSPDGKVADVRVITSRFQGTFVEECLVREIARWSFPGFQGEAYDLVFPLLLTAQETY